MHGTCVKKSIVPVPIPRTYVISSVRDLIARQISFLYQISFIFPAKLTDEHGEIDPVLASRFLNDFIPKENTLSYLLNWFDKEVKSYFGVHVYQHTFDKEADWGVIETDSTSMLIVQMEKLSELLPTVVPDFFGVDVPIPVIRRNETKRKVKGTDKLFKTSGFARKLLIGYTRRASCSTSTLKMTWTPSSRGGAVKAIDSSKHTGGKLTFG